MGNISFLLGMASSTAGGSVCYWLVSRPPFFSPAEEETELAASYYL